MGVHVEPDFGVDTPINWAERPPLNGGDYLACERRGHRGPEWQPGLGERLDVVADGYHAAHGQGRPLPQRGIRSRDLGPRLTRGARRLRFGVVRHLLEHEWWWTLWTTVSASTRRPISRGEQHNWQDYQHRPQPRRQHRAKTTRIGGPHACAGTDSAGDVG